jgi:16S rRNA C1402 N4-methylase RsmH
MQSAKIWCSKKAPSCREGGHSVALLEAHPEAQLFLGVDVDARAHEIAGERLNASRESQGWGCELKYARSNFSQIRRAVEDAFGVGGVDGILLDVGVSSMQARLPAYMILPTCLQMILASA